MALRWPGRAALCYTAGMQPGPGQAALPPEPRGELRPARAPVFFAAAALAALLAASVVLRASEPSRANHDVAWHVYAGGVLLDGGRYGADVVDNNPPLVYWLAQSAVALARGLGAAPLVVYGLFAFGLALCASALARRELRDALGSAALADALALALLALLTLAPGFDFAQRDPILAACVLPYLLAAGGAATGRQLPRARGLAVGALAGFGISLKPHYVLLWLGVEAWLTMRGPGRGAWRRAENAGLVATGGLYVVAVLLLTPSYLEMVRVAWGLYGTYGHPVPLLGPTTWAVAAALAASLLVPLPRGAARAAEARGASRVAEGMAVAALLALLALVVQGKDFSYHHVPPRLFAAAAWLLVAAGALGRPAAWAARAQTAALWTVTAVVLGCATFAVATLQRPVARRAGIVELAALIERQAPRQEVLVFSSSVDPLFPALDFTASRSASPYSCLWLIAGHYERSERRAPGFPYRSLEEMGAVERDFMEDFVGDVTAHRPRLLLFEKTPVKQGFGPTHFDFERYFRADPRFGPWLAGYERRGPKRLLVDGLRTFDIWVRRDGASGA